MTATTTRKLKSDEMVCPKCLAIVKSWNDNHADSATCLAEQSRRQTAERGLTYIYAPAVKVAVKAGLKPLFELASMRDEIVSFMRFQSKEDIWGEKSWFEQVVKGWFGPRWIMWVWNHTAGLRTTDKINLFRFVHANPDFILTMKALKRITSGGLKDVLKDKAIELRGKP